MRARHDPCAASSRVTTKEEQVSGMSQSPGVAARLEQSEDLGMIRRWRSNVLVVGSDRAVTAMLPDVLSGCRQPVHGIAHGHPGRWPQEGTVVLRNLSAFDLSAQQVLFRWLDEIGARVQVVSVPGAPMFPLLAAGAFSAALFYRLNVITVLAAERHPGSSTTAP